MLETFGIMGLGSWIVMGLIAGAVARFLLPGKDPGGCITTPIIGVIGALIGGFVATYLDFGGISGFDIRSLVIATLGSIALLIVLRLFKGEDKKD